MFEINKNLKAGKYRVADVVKGLEKSAVLKKIFGKKLKQILSSEIVELNRKKWLIWVDQKRKLIRINIEYFLETDDRALYLDFVHELVHFKQMTEGKDLFDNRFSYVERPTEIEAYKYTVEEARNIGMSRKEIVEYLKVEWIDEEEHKKLVEIVLGKA